MQGFIPVEGGRVYYRIEGEGEKTPLLVLHGGPGFAHNLLSPLSQLGTDRKIIFYDQLGSGKSDRPNDLSLWTIERFVDELAKVREFLKLDEIILYGASWGTLLAVEYLLSTPQPKGVKGLILSSPCMSAKMWKEDADRLRLQLPADIQKILLEHEANGTTQSPEYQTAMWEYLKRFACRLDPIPQSVLDAFQDANHDIYNYMWGPSEFFPTGTLKNYDRLNDLHRIQVPTLFLCGRYDEATPESTAEYAKQIKGAQVKIIEEGSHATIVEKPEEHVALVRDFLQAS